MKSNFTFLEKYWPELAQLGAAAESYLHSDPNASIYKSGLLAERIVSEILAYEKINLDYETTHAERIQIAKRAGIIPSNVDDLLYALRKGRNDAVHGDLNSEEQAETLLKMAFRLSSWFMEVYGDWQYKAAEYKEPEPAQSNDELEQRIKRQEEKLQELLERLDSEPATTPASEQNSDVEDRRSRSQEAANEIKLSAEESTYLSSEKVRLNIKNLSVVNFALQQNGFPIIHNITVTNETDTDIADAVIRITSNPSVCLPYEKHVDFVPAKSEFEVKNVELKIDANYLAGLTERINGTLTVEISSDEQILNTETLEIGFLAYNEWHGYHVYPELLAAFVTPNNPAVNAIISRAATFMKEWTNDAALDAYQSKDTNRVQLMAAAVFKALQEQNIVYAEPPASFEKSGQRIRLCDEVLNTKLGTCLDLTLMYVGCLEAIGLNPLIILQPGHVFAGLWLEESNFGESVQDDASLITKRIAEGSRVISVVECTLFTADRHATFDDACSAAEYRLHRLGDVECFIDLHRARLSGIRPLPERVKTQDGWIINRPKVAGSELTSAPSRISEPLDLSDAEDSVFSKKVLWERKLLDLGMRNNLLNMRLTRTMIPIISSSLDDLEDALANGDDFYVRPKLEDWNPIEGKEGFEALHVVEQYENLLKTEFKNHRLRSSLTDAELNVKLKNLYRAAKTDMEENGANTLYLAMGLLKWYETDRSTKERFAPILLVPIEMVRKSAAEGYVIRLRDDETMLNITLMEKLHQDFSIVIPGLDPLPQDDSGVDTRRVFAIVRQAIMEQRRWDVLESACLGIFSFSQFVMWNDIHNRAEDLSRNKVVKSLMENQLVWDAEQMSIDGVVPEDKALLPIPADASQLYAIEAAEEGKSFVLHGPPGTGKSQTITGLIANALAQGKTVLFVAEKMAALEVVQKRLADIQLGPFCLELHSNKAKKKDVLEQLRQASEVTKYQSPSAYEATANRIKTVRKELDQYAAALHKKQHCGMSIFELINEFEKVENSDSIPLFSHAFVSEETEDRLYDQNAVISRLVVAGKDIGHPHDHPLTAVKSKTYTNTLRNTLPDIISSYKTRLSVLRDKADIFATQIKNERPMTFRELGVLAYLADSIRDLESYPAGWATIHDFNTYESAVRELAEHEMNMAMYEQSLDERWEKEFLGQDGVALLDQYSKNSVKWSVGKSIAFRQMTKELEQFAKGSVQLNSLGKDIANLIAYQEEASAAKSLFDAVGSTLGFLYRDESTDWERVARDVSAAKKTINTIDIILGDPSARCKLCADDTIHTSSTSVSGAWSKVFETKEQLYSLLEINNKEYSDWISGELELCNSIYDNSYQLREWITWNKVSEEAKELGLDNVITAYVNGLEHDHVLPAFQKAAYKSLIIDGIDRDDSLNTFTGNEFNEKVAQLRRLDSELTQLTQNEIYCRLAARVPNFTTASVGSSETGILQRAIQSRGRGISIRKLFEQIPNLLPRLCPCMLMSPISVAQYLDPNSKPFDLVVFDEASQLPTSKAVGALARGKDAIIVGDPKQMPPTSFFASNTTDEDHLDEEDLESILDDCLALNMPQTKLLWHYRSRHESLISFSNSHFYENKLYTFPSVNDRESRVRLVHVDGVFERGTKRVNRAEAEAVVEELMRRFEDPDASKLSVGVVTFNISQQNLIDDLVTDACASNPEFEKWVYESKEPMFIKNLENVQGDERDVILFSIGYGPDQNGRVSMNFGPLNREGGWRRLNVAVSRARYEMIVFATLTPDQINLSRTKAEGVAALKEFMEYASRHSLPDSETTSFDSQKQTNGIVDAICEALQKHGYETEKNIGESAFKIDIGVIDQQNPEKYILGILLDGNGYKDAQTTRDREIAQINVLKGLGWNLFRVWTMDWWDNNEREIKNILDELESLKTETPKKPHNTDDVEDPPKTPVFKMMAEPLIVEEPSIDRLKKYQAANLPQSSCPPEDFITHSRSHDANVERRVNTVLQVESPICESLLTRKIVQSFGIARVGNRIQAYMNKIYKRMHLTSTFSDGERVYWKNGQTPESYTDFRVNTEKVKRDAKEVPVEEAVNAVVKAIENQFSLSHEDLVKESAKLMGFNRVGNAVYARFELAVQSAKERGKIVKSENGLWIKRES